MTAVDVPFDLLDRAAYVPGSDALVLADVHLGRAADSAVDAPIDDGGDALARLERLVERTDPGVVVVAGDLLHAFDRVPRGVSRDCAALEACVADAGARLVVVPGNHDAALDAVYGGETAPEYRLADGETVVCHGHDEPTTDASRYVVGHDHPALSVGGRKLPCALYGPDAYDGADVLMLPAFTRLAPGATVNGMRGRDFQSPLVADADAFYPAVRDVDADAGGAREETLWFPPLGECRRVL